MLERFQAGQANILQRRQQPLRKKILLDLSSKATYGVSKTSYLIAQKVADLIRLERGRQSQQSRVRLHFQLRQRSQHVQQQRDHVFNREPEGASVNQSKPQL